MIVAVANSLATDAQLRYGFRFGGDFAKASLGNADALSGACLAPHTAYEPNNHKEPVSLVNRSGFSGGLVLEYQFEKCGFAPDIALLYTRYNTRLALQDEKPQSFGRNFIEIPIHLKWKFWIPQTKNLFAPMVYTGPSMMFRLDHNSGINYTFPFTTHTNLSHSPSEPYTGHTATRSELPVHSFKSNVFQPGWDVGIGFDIINFIQITAGYRFGLGNALNSPKDVTLHTNAWTVAATLLFDF
ncbi:MAG: PorT family protein [Muribaculaceae bacterium]|nr:PorT family protein [Muribaculaceae bacterium]